MTAFTFTAKVTDTVTDELGSKTATFNVATPSANTALFGASLGPVTANNAYVQTWITNVGRPLAVRHYFASGAIWPSYTASPFNGEAGLRKILCDFELARDGSDKAAFETFLASCETAGLELDVTLWHAAPSKGFSGPSAYWQALKPYVPLVYKHSARHIFDLTGWQIVHDNQLAAWWPGDTVQVSAIGVEYYDPGWSGGQRMDDTSAFCTSKNVAFALAEFGMNFKTAAGGTIDEQGGLNMLKHVYNVYAARIKAGTAIDDCDLWSNITGNTAPGYQIQNQPKSWINGTTINGVFYPGYKQLADLLAGK